VNKLHRQIRCQRCQHSCSKQSTLSDYGTQSDLRHLTTAEEVVAAIVEHLNNQLAAGIFTPPLAFLYSIALDNWVFASGIHNLFANAEYRQADGSIVGDPTQVEMNKLCQQFGWREGTAFDVLPLIIHMLPVIARVLSISPFH
jgi:nitric oxide synthase oxygenase domain/subunit